MNSNLKLLPAALLVAMLALAGCGGGSDTPDPDPDPPTTPEPAPPASVESLSLAIQTAENDAMAANKMAADALKSAMKYEEMLTTTQVAGDSGVAMMAAQAILKAEMDVGTALTNAEKALADANAAKMNVMALADDHPHKATLMTSVDRVVEMAEMYVDTIKGISTGTALEGAVVAVEGTNGKGTPRSVANAVGEDISAALVGGTRRAHGTTAPAAEIADAHKLSMNDSRGMTWEELVMSRGGTVVTKPIGVIGTPGNAGLKVASITGMDSSKVWTTPPTTGLDDGTEHANATYMGIPGAAFCLGTDCAITGGKLVGSWYFAPTAPGTHWVRNTDTDTRDDMPYVHDSMYATYGHWLSVDSGTGDWTVTTFAHFSDSSNAGITETNAAASAALGPASALTGVDDDDKATYSGSAAGMSVLTSGSGDSKTTDSGRFTANVTLNASFGNSPTVSGKVDTFVGDAVNTAWSATLESAPIGSGGTDGTAGTVVTNGTNGTWTAQAYGPNDTSRPVGIIGGFLAHFADGNAAGAYATTKD